MSISIQDIRQTIRVIECEGYEREEIEAILVHSRDLDELIILMNDKVRFKNEAVPYKYTQHAPTYICGVKILRSYDIPRGSIIRIFKDMGQSPPIVCADDCECDHDFRPIIDTDGSSSFYKCIGCSRIVSAMVGLKYQLSGILEC